MSRREPPCARPPYPTPGQSCTAALAPQRHIRHPPPRSATSRLRQASGFFVLVQYTRAIPGDRYESLVVVLLIEVTKFFLCSVMIIFGAASRGACRARNGFGCGVLLEQKRTTLMLAVPAICYTIQNNLLFVAITNLSAIVAQVKKSVGAWDRALLVNACEWAMRREPSSAGDR